MTIHYQSERLYVRDLLPEDAQGIYELDTDPRVMKFLGGVTMTSIEKAKKIVENIIWQYEEFGMGRLAIIDKTNEEFIGWTGIKRERNVRDFIYYDLGYRIKHKYWGKGIATETAKFSLEHGFNTLKLDEICGAADLEHIASQKVLMKVGLELKGTFFYEDEECKWFVINRNRWERFYSKTN